MKRAKISKYIYHKRYGICMYGISVLVFAVLFALSQIPFRHIWYPALLCFCIFLTFGCVDYLRFNKKHRQLLHAVHAIDVTMEYLPEAYDLLEEDYQQLLCVMNERKNESLEHYRQKSEELTEYLTLWSHQIKTPMTALQLTTDGINEPARTETKKQIFEIEQYVDMMLQYLRLQDNTSDLVLQKYYLCDMVNQAVKYYARVFISKKLAVHIDIEEKKMVVTDEKWFVFVLKQLLSNALKYTDAGAITIRVRQSEANAPLVLEITDTGIGIAKEDVPRIFERGYTGYNGRKDKKATGLGLYLTNQVLAMLNHSICIMSDIGKGTTVAITFIGETK